MLINTDFTEDFIGRKRKNTLTYIYLFQIDTPVLLSKFPLEKMSKTSFFLSPSSLYFFTVSEIISIFCNSLVLAPILHA